jgi:hypothetical protein
LPVDLQKIRNHSCRSISLNLYEKLPQPFILWDASLIPLWIDKLLVVLVYNKGDGDESILFTKLLTYDGKVTRKRNFPLNRFHGGKTLGLSFIVLVFEPAESLLNDKMLLFDNDMNRLREIDLNHEVDGIETHQDIIYILDGKTKKISLYNTEFLIVKQFYIARFLEVIHVQNTLFVSGSLLYYWVSNNEFDVYDLSTTNIIRSFNVDEATPRYEDVTFIEHRFKNVDAFNRLISFDYHRKRISVYNTNGFLMDTIFYNLPKTSAIRPDGSVITIENDLSFLKMF